MSDDSIDPPGDDTVRSGEAGPSSTLVAPGAGQPAADRAHWPSQGRRGLVMRPSFEIAEHHWGAVLLRQMVDFVVQQRPELADP